jgi:hypothetical protein
VRRPPHRAEIRRGKSPQRSWGLLYLLILLVFCLSRPAVRGAHEVGVERLRYLLFSLLSNNEENRENEEGCAFSVGFSIS